MEDPGNLQLCETVRKDVMFSYTCRDGSAGLFSRKDSVNKLFWVGSISGSEVPADAFRINGLEPSPTSCRVVIGRNLTNGYKQVLELDPFNVIESTLPCIYLYTDSQGLWWVMYIVYDSCIFVLSASFHLSVCLMLHQWPVSEFNAM